MKFITKLRFLSLFLFLCVFSSVFMGCSEDSDTPEPDPVDELNGKTSCLLTSVISQESSTTSSTFNYEYNSQDLPVKIRFSLTSEGTTQNSEADLEYDTNGRLIKITTDANNFVDLSYPEGDSTIEINIVSEISVFSNQFTLKLDDLGRVVEYAGVLRYEYDDTERTIKTYVLDSGVDLYLADERKYDDKINPFVAPVTTILTSTSSGEVVFFDFDPLGGNDHNIIQRRSFDFNGSLLSEINTNYEYNSLGYPVLGSVANTTITAEYTYACK